MLHLENPESFVFAVMRKHFGANDVLVTGGARGTDSIMISYVKQLHGSDARDYMEVIKPKGHYPGAPNARNVILAQKCERAIGIWNPAFSTGKGVLDLPVEQTVLSIPRSGTWHSITETVRKRKPLTLYIVMPEERIAVVNLRNDTIPDGSPYAMRKSDVTTIA